MKKKIIVLIVSICMLLSTLALTGCGGSTKDEQTASPSDSSATSDNADNAAGTSNNPVSNTDTGNGDPQYGGVLKLATLHTIANPGYTPINSTNAAMIYLSGCI